MADDEEAVVLACKTISCFIIIFLFTNEINSFIDTNYGSSVSGGDKIMPPRRGKCPGGIK